MRLTLRTLLAYLDQILDEPDAEELEHKIQESELATQLVQRIRTVLGQRRVAAIDVGASGLGRDANSVAEYLDNTLPADEIPDFERICIDSDVHLSEVAACHQILTLVLGEPAAVPEGLKERVYGLPRNHVVHPRAADEALPSPSAVPSPSAMESSSAVPSPSAMESSSAPAERRSAADDEVLNTLLGSSAGPAGARIDEPVTAGPPGEAEAAAAWDEDEHWTEAPDYLKRPRPGRWKPVAIITLIAFCLAMAALRGMGKLDRNHPLAQRFGLFGAASSSEESETEPSAGDALGPAAPPNIADRGASQANGAQADTGLSDADSLSGEEPAADGVSSAAQAATAAPVDEEPFPDLPLPANASAANRASARPDTGAPPSTSSVVSEEPGGRATDDLAATDLGLDPSADAAGQTAPHPDSIAEPTDASPALVNPLATSRNEDRSPPVPVPPSSGARRDLSAEQPTIDDGPDSAPPAVAPAARVLDIGRFLDPQQVLVKWAPQDELWQRVDVGTRLQVGDVLMSLPTYRSPLVLASGMQVNLIGGTRVEVLEPDANSTPFFQLEFGQLTVATFAQAGITFGLRWAPDHAGVVRFADTNTTLAIELKPERLPGADPEATPAHQVLHVYVTSGSAEWSSEQGPPINIAAGQRLTLIDAYPALLKDVPRQPDWIDGRDGRPRDPIAARDLAERLTTDRPVTLVLKEEADSRRFEVRSLAVCSLAYLGDFDPLFVALNDVKLRVYWPAEYEVLERVPSYSPEFMASCQKAILQRHGEEEGMKLYRMLWGFSAEQLAEGSAVDLFDYLEHPSFDFRIVASELLKSITGQPSLYRANAGDRDPQRRAAVSRWRKMLDNGEIVYQRPPELVELLNEVAPRQ